MTYQHVVIDEDKNTTIVSKRPLEQKATMQYLNAIDNRDHNAVAALDKKLKNGDFGTGEDLDKISKIRKTLLDLAKDSPEKVRDIYNNAVRKYRKIMTPTEKLKVYQKKLIGKKIRLKNDVQAGYFGSTSKFNIYYPKGTEGNVLKIKENVKNIPDQNGKMINFISYDFLMDMGDGNKKWFSSNDIETAF